MKVKLKENHPFLEMILQLYQITPFQVFFNSSIGRKYFAQSAARKNSHQILVRCEINNKDLQTKTPIHQQTQWSHNFVEGLESSSVMNYKEKVNELEEKVNELEEKVNLMIIDYENGGISTLGLLELVDDIERLGLGYRFKTHITRVLDKIATTNEKSFGFEEDDMLYAASLRFRLLRQHGYSVLPDFLTRFKGNRGGLIGYPQTDVKTLISLYEASYTGFEKETDLHEVKLITSEHLRNINGLENDIMDHINHVLDVPLYRRMPRLETRWYINAYGKRKDANQHLLNLAILDFNMVQSVYQRDLQEASKWWKNLGITKLNLVRDRLMECFFVSVGAVDEPQYSSCRVDLTKVVKFTTSIDDIYDLHGTVNELEVLTSAVKRWDIHAMEFMPEYIQIGFLALYNTVNEMGYNSLMSGGKNIIPFLSKAWGELLEAYFVEAKWTKSGHMPTLEEYLDNGWRSITQVTILTHGYYFMNQDIEKRATEPLERLTELFKWSSISSRICNDLATSSGEMMSGKNLNAVSCYMHEKGTSEEIAREYVETLREKAWMKMIEARINCSKESTDPFIDMAINLARFSHCVYQHGDGIGAPGARAKDRLLSIIIEPIKFP